MIKAGEYRKLREELDAILSQLQAGELDIEEATAKYERATRIVKDLEEYIKKAENNLKQVRKTRG